MPIRSHAAAGLALLVLCAAAPAQDGLDLGTSSFQFLRLPLSPRVTAMGGAGAALPGGPLEAEVNPAASARGTGALVAGREHPARQFATTASHVSWNLPWGDHRVVLHARYLGFDAIPGWDSDNNSTTPYEAHTLKLQAGGAGSRFGVEWGGSAAYARNNVADATYSALLLNLGARRDLPAGISAGVSVTNVDLWSGKTREAGEPVEAPVTLRAGLGYMRDLFPGSRLALALDARRINDEDFTFPVGAEYVFMNALSVRAGWPFGDPDNRLTAGIGLKWSRFGFHYAYKGHSALSGGHGWALEVGGL